MRFFYAAPHLRSEIGHNANYCRAIVKGLGAYGIETIVLGSAYVSKELQQELGAIPFFTMSGDWRSDGDPVSGWLNAFDDGTAVTAADFARLTDIRADDLIYLNAVWPAQIMALGSWLGTLKANATPTAVVEFVVGPGVAVNEDEGGLALGLPDPQVDSRALLYRFVAHKLLNGGPRRLHFATLDERCSAIYAALLGTDVQALPWPYETSKPPRRRSRADSIVVATLGYQRRQKGYHLMPEVVAEILRGNIDVHVLVHNSVPTEMPEVQQSLRDIAQHNGRLLLSEASVDADTWEALLDRADLIVCPYNPAPYASSHSAVTAEAIARGIPLVVPAGTVLATCLERFGGPGVTFAEYAAPAIKDAIQQALDRFDDLAARAYTAAHQWQASQGSRAFVESVLQLAQRAPRT